MSKQIKILIVVIIVFVVVNILLYTWPKATWCEDINWEEVDSNNEEYSFAHTYCSGDFCSITTDADGNSQAVTSQAVCESIDVIDGNKVTKSGQDGKADCKWDAEADPLTQCKPNKLK